MSDRTCPNCGKGLAAYETTHHGPDARYDCSAVAAVVEPPREGPPAIGTARRLAERMYMADRKRLLAEADDRRGAALQNPPWDSVSYDTQKKYLKWAQKAWDLGLPEGLVAAWRGESGDLLSRLGEAEKEITRLRSALSAAQRAIGKACEIIELGDQRLLAGDGPAGGQPPELSLAEWRELYVTLDTVRASRPTGTPDP